MRDKIKNLIKTKNNNSDDYDDKFLKVKSNFDDDLPSKEDWCYGNC